MSRYADLKKNRNSETSQEKEKTTQSRYQALKKNRGKNNYDYGVDESFINTFIRDSQRFLKQSQDEASGRTWESATDKDRNQSRNDDIADLRSRSATLRAYLNANKHRMDNSSYKELMSYLDSFDSARSSVFHNFHYAEKFYSQWDTADDYKKYQQEQKDYEDLLNFDRDAGDKEIKDLEALLEEYEYLIPRQDVQNPNSEFNIRLREIRQQYGSKDDIQKLLSDKTAYRNRAKWTQEGVAMSGATKNADFDKYSGYVSTKADNWWENLRSQYGMGYEDLTYEYINGAENGMRDEIKSKHRAYSSDSPSDDGESIFEENGYDHMTENEISIYNYYYAKEGKEAAEKYLHSIQETLNKRKAGKDFKAYDDNTLLELAFGVTAGLDQFKTGISSLFNTKDDYIPYSSTQILSGMIREDLNDVDLKYYNIKDGEWDDTKILGSSLGQGAYDLITTTSNMAPSILVSTYAGMVNPVLGTAVMSTSVGASAAGNAYQEKLNLGYSKEDARTYGTLVGVSEAVLETVLGTVGKYSGNLLNKTVLKNLSAVDNVFSKFAQSTGGRLLMNGASEALEEGLQSVIEPYLWQAVSGEETDVDWQEAMYSALLGFAMGGVFEAGGIAVNNAVTNSNNIRTGSDIMQAGGTNALLEFAYKQAGATTQNEITALADKVKGKVESGSTSRATQKNVGKLYNTVKSANNLANASANQADISKSLQRKGFDADTANNIAEALVASYNGQELSKAQTKLLKTFKDNKDVQNAISTIMTNDQSTMGQRSMKSFDKEIALNLLAKKNGVERTVGDGSTVVDIAIKKAISEEFTPKGELKVSDSTKAIRTDTNEEIDIKRVSAVNKDNLVLELADGTTINAKDVSFASEGDALVYEAIAKLGDKINAETANKLLSKYDGKNAEVFARGMAQAYTYGFHGFDKSELSSKSFLASGFTEEMRNYAYGLGAQYRPVKDTADRAKERTTAKEEKGVYYRDKDGNATSIETYLKESNVKLSARQKTGIEVMRKFSEMMGTRFNVFETWVENGTKYYLDENGVKQKGNPNGFYDPDTGTIYIALDAGETFENGFRDTMLFTIAHEMTHFMKDWSPEHFTKISKIIFQQAGFKGHMDELIADKMAQRKANGKPISYDTAVEEVVADAMETILKDGKVAEFMAEVKKKDNVAWQKLKSWFKKLAEFFRNVANVYRGETANTTEGSLVADFAEDILRQIEQIWAEGAVSAGENYQTALESVVEENAEAVSSDEIITDGAVVTDGEGTKFSIKSMKHDIAEGQMFEDLKNICGWSQKQVDELRNNLKDLVEYMTPYRNILDMNETYGREGRRFSPYKPNSDPLYKISMDFSTLCSKRLLTQYVIENLQLRENRPMSAEEQMAIRDMLNEYRKVEKGLQVACAMCYVEAARLKSPKQIQRWLSDPAPLLRDYFGKKNKAFNDSVKEAQADFKESRGYARNTPKKDMKPADVKELNKIGPKLRSKYQLSAEEQAIVDKAKTLPNSTYLTAGNLSDLSETDPVIYDAYTAFVRTATRSKSLETDEPYYYGDSRRDNGNGIVVSDSFIEAVNRENGMRFSSWSDWRIQHLLDYITAVIDNSVRGAAMHGYTKFGEEVRVLGKTGMMFNMSGVAGTQTGLNEDGSLSFSPTESIDVNEAIQLREEFPEHAGLQCIGVSDAHIIELLKSDIIDYVIPYHVSGLNAALRRMADIYGWDDYTGTQNASIDKSIKKENAVDPEHWHEEPVFSEFFVGYDTGMSGIEAMRASAERYKQMCKDRGLTPKFNQFANEANYWKLLIDRKMINQQTGNLIRQKAVTPTFDFNTIKGVVDRYVDNYDSGLEARALNHIVENWDSIPKRIKDLKKQGGTKAKKTKKAVDTLSNQTLAAQPATTKQSERVTDKKRLAFLNEQLRNGEVTEVFRAMAVDDEGNLYPPMAGFVKVNGKKVINGQPSVIGAWEQSTESIKWESVDEEFLIANGFKYYPKPNKDYPNGRYEKDNDIFYRNKDGEWKAKFHLFKDNGEKVDAAYAPYIHTSLSVLNDQFTSAYKRDNLVVVRGYVPNSEIYGENGKIYHANFADKPVGKTKWHSGVVAAQMPETRTVILSRYFMPIEIVEDAEFAQKTKDMMQGKDIEIPFNVVTPNQRRALEAIGVRIGEARGLKDPPKKADVKYSDRNNAPTFYSQMAKVVDAVKQEKLGAASVVSMLRGKGVKAEEIKWSGIEEWLAGKKSVTKAELQEFIAGSMLQIEEQGTDGTIKYTPEQKARRDELSETYGSLWESADQYWFGLFGDWLPYEVYSADDGTDIIRNKVKESGDGASESGKKLLKLADDIDKVKQDIADLEAEAKKQSKLTRWKQYALKGGENYREILFKLPGSEYTNPAMRTHWGDATGVLAHARVQDFDVNGKKMLFIEEIQSDWHNEGHSKGYESAEYKEAERVSDELFNEWQKVRKPFHQYVRSNEFNTDPEDVRKKKYDWLRSKVEAAEKKWQEAERYVESLREKGAGAVPDAPFRNNYHEFVLKRLLRMAAEEGYDSIGWTTADIQSDRWSDKYAEGYRIEYDQDMPKFLKKYGKRWGAEVGKTALETEFEPKYYDPNRMEEYYSIVEWENEVLNNLSFQGLPVRDLKKVRFIESDGYLIAEDPDTGLEYDRAEIRTPSNKVWSMDITPAMKESVLTEGQPLYSERVLMGSLFSGGGTLEAGLAYQMLDKEFGVEYDGRIAAVYAENHGDHIQVGKVEDFDISKYDDIFYLHASPVCHNFSKAKHGAKELQMDIDSAKATAKHLETAMPQVFTVENAPAYRKSESLKIITNKLTELGYKWDVDVYNSADYGSATSRNRVILRAVKDGELPPKPTKQERTNSWDKVTRDLWGTLPKAELRPSFISAIENTRNLPILDANGKVNVNKPLLILTTTSGHMVTYCWEGDICPTLTTKCGEARLIMPDGNIYAVTPEFMGRIQGLPDDYKYPKAKTRAFTIIGNGIPTHLTKAVIGGVLDSAYEQTHDGQVLYQDRAEDSVSNRALLANAFEGIAKPEELPKIQEYKDKVALINAEEKKLRELNEQIKELSFAKGPRDNKRIKDLRFDAVQAANRINTYDKQLLRLEASEPLQKVLNREKKLAYKKAEQRGKEALAEYKAKVEAQQKETAEKWRDSRKTAVAKARETAEKRDARAKLQKLVLDTVKWISYPAKTDVKCPDILKKPYESFLQGIDLSSKRLANGGEATNNDLRLANAMDSLATAIDRVMLSQDPSQEVDKVLDIGYLDLPADFVQKLRDMTESIKSMMVEGEYVVNNMTAAEVRQLSQMIRTLNHAIKTMSKLYANLRFANVEALGFDTIDFLDTIGEIEKTSGMKDFAQWDNALPFYAFKRFGKGGESVFEGLMDAQDKLAFLAQGIFDFQEKTWTGKEAKAWSEDTHTIALPNGTELTLTTADAMSIYCLSRREHALPHLLGGGIRVMGIQKGSQKAKDSRSLLTIKDVDSIISSLTDRQKQVAEGIQEFMSTVCSEWGNEISMKRFLTREFTEKFYFPIESNDENLTVKDPSAQQSDLFRLLNISATKPLTQGANNEVIIRNIFDVFTGHASDMARLNAYGMGLLDYMKWLNYRERGVNEEGQINVKGVRKSMEKAYGKAANSYVLNLIKDVNGRASDGGDPTILMKWMRAAKTASVGNSLRVATLQITSYPRASLVLSPKSLALGLSKLPKIEMAKKYCGIALWKSFGFYDTNISRSIEDQMKGVTDVKQKLIELSLKGAEWGDAITWGALWNACEYEVAKTTQNKVGSEEFYQEVGKKLREVVYRTQVVDSTLTRSQMMRSKRGMTQEASAFMSEPTLSANILMDAGFEFGLEKRRTGSAKKAWAKTGAYIGRAVAVYSIGQLAAALLEGLWDAWRDDEDEEFGEKFLSAFVENLALDLVPFNKLPIVSDVFEAALSMFGIGFYSSDKMSTTWLTQAVSAVDAWKDVFSGESSVTTYNALYKTVRAISSFYGVSFSGVMREGVALWNNTAGAYDTTLKIRQYDLSKSDLGTEVYEAIISGNTKQATSLKAQFEDEASYHSAVRKALRENDPRIKEAAMAQINGDPSERVRIAKLIIADGFVQDDVVMAINSEVNALTPDDDSSGTAKAKGFYTTDDFAVEITNGDQASAYAVKEDIIATAMKNGKTEEQAIESFEGSAKSSLKKLFATGSISESQAINALVTYCGVEQEKAEELVGEWVFANEYGFDYSDRKDAYLSGNISASELKTILMDVGGKTAEEADLQIEAYDWEAEGYEGATTAAIREYKKFCASSNVPKDVYLHIRSFSNDTENDVDANGKTIYYSAMKKVMAEINRQYGLTSVQKTAIARSLGWSEKNINKYKPW